MPVLISIYSLYEFFSGIYKKNIVENPKGNVDELVGAEKRGKAFELTVRQTQPYISFLPFNLFPQI